MDWRTNFLNPEPRARLDFRSLATPVYRGSTVVFDNQASVKDDWQQAEKGYSYGLYGTPTTLELASRIADLEGARHTFIVPGGQAAIALAIWRIVKQAVTRLFLFPPMGQTRKWPRDYCAA
jgi:cystathionine beta-lyase